MKPHIKKMCDVAKVPQELYSHEGGGCGGLIYVKLPSKNYLQSHFSLGRHVPCAI
jgi:hypothetical protein